MFQIIYRECFSGFAVSRVKRDRDFTKNVGYFRNEYQIQYIIDGERYYFESGIRCVKMAAGSVAFIDKRRIPKLNIIGGRYHDQILIEIKEAEFAPICQAVGIDMEWVFSQRCGVFQTGKCEEIRDVFEKIEKTITDWGTEQRELRLRMLILNLLVCSSQLEKFREKNFHSASMQGSLEKQKRVCMIADYLAGHYEEHENVDELAGRFYMSRSYLCRIFKEVTNFTVSEYVNLFRIAASREYLLNREMTMTEIANCLGFNSLTYFERVFKQLMSVTPGEYRKQYLGARGKRRD